MKPNSGFTLMEILIALGLMTVVGIVLSLVFVQSNGIFSQQTNRINAGLGTNNLSIVLSDGVKMASGIAAQYPSTGIAQYTSGSETIVLMVPSINSSGSIIDNTYDYFIYTKDPQKTYLFKKIVFPNASSNRKSENRVLLSNLSQVSFQYLNDSGSSVSPGQATNIKYSISSSQQSEKSSTSGQLILRND